MSDYYDIHFREYFEKTQGLDPSSFLEPLLGFLPQNAEILDIGCGSGRDMAWLRSKGYRPSGFEKSGGMADLARKRSGCLVMEGDYLAHDFSSFCVDAIILSASLVHQPHDLLLPILAKIRKALKKQGVMYISLKYGKGEKTDSLGRKFYLWQDQDLRTLFDVLCMKVVFWGMTPSARGTDEIWLNYVLEN